jgi:alpha-amylase/alpha-mannosidase (GH57 family)
MERYICIHGHFYQPPRDNPWLEAIELQDSAYPYHDWNERITAECYAPNGASRILDGDGRIVKIPNNYAKISFNVGPTLLAWLEENEPEVYQTILEADRQSRRRFSGHGSALAQAYNHMILPLSNPRDKYTQVWWGIKDFEKRFGRRPEGMWLPETAVNVETLEILAELGIKFTILAPHQARRVKEIGHSSWMDVGRGSIDPTRAYLHRLPSGRQINLFFYDGPISQAVAFDDILTRGEDFARRLAGAFSPDGGRPQLVHIATDGETYGHHRHHGDMALAYALAYIETHKLARLTNYGEYLEKRPPAWEVEIVANTSWSCAHGVDRWWRDCGCHSGGHPGWNQAWRTPLRNALDWLRGTLAPLYEERAGAYLKDPWEARNAYIEVILDRSRENVERFLSQQAIRELRHDEKVTVLRALEMQRHAMLMYTSCGWFFDELSGLETVQVIQYAGRAVQLAQEISGKRMEGQFLTRLKQAKSNLPQHRDGRQIYEKFVKPARVDLLKFGTHYAVSSLFEDYSEKTKIYCYLADRLDYRTMEAGRARLAVGRVRVTSEITQQSSQISFGVLHFGDHNLSCGVRKFKGKETYAAMVREVLEIFAKADFPETILTLNRHFRSSTYSLQSLFRDEQRKVLGPILEIPMAEYEAHFRQLYAYQAPLMRFLKNLGVPLPKLFHTAAEFVINLDLLKALKDEELDLSLIYSLLEAYRLWEIELDVRGLGFAFQKNLEKWAARYRDQPDNLAYLQIFENMADLLPQLPWETNIWKVQNYFYELLREVYPGFRKRAKSEDAGARLWVEHFTALGKRLGFRMH